MDLRHKYIIRRNEKLLRDNIHAKSLTPYLIQDKILSVDDAERIGKEVTSDDKAYRLIRIVETHPNGFASFLKALKDEGLDFIVEKLESTEIDEKEITDVKVGYDCQIIEILRKNYCEDDDSKHFVILANIEEEVLLGFRMVGEVYNIHIDHLRMIVTKHFTKCVQHKRKKTKEYP